MVFFLCVRGARGKGEDGGGAWECCLRVACFVCVERTIQQVGMENGVMRRSDKGSEEQDVDRKENDKSERLMDVNRRTGRRRTMSVRGSRAPSADDSGPSDRSSELKGVTPKRSDRNSRAPSAEPHSNSGKTRVVRKSRAPSVELEEAPRSGRTRQIQPARAESRSDRSRAPSADACEASSTVPRLRPATSSNKSLRTSRAPSKEPVSSRSPQRSQRQPGSRMMSDVGTGNGRRNLPGNLSGTAWRTHAENATKSRATRHASMRNGPQTRRIAKPKEQMLFRDAESAREDPITSLITTSDNSFVNEGGDGKRKGFLGFKKGDKLKPCVAVFESVICAKVVDGNNLMIDAVPPMLPYEIFELQENYKLALTAKDYDGVRARLAGLEARGYHVLEDGTVARRIRVKLRHIHTPIEYNLTAKSFLEQFVVGQAVDCYTVAIDYHGRAISEVVLCGTRVELSLSLIEVGLAKLKTERPPAPLFTAQGRAQIARTGLWADSSNLPKH